MDDSINLESKSLRSINIWTNDVDNEINNSRSTILVINIINIEHYDLQSNFVIQSCNGSKQKTQFLKDENFTKSSYSMMMEKFEYGSLLRQSNEEQRLIFDDVMHKNEFYSNTQICLFLIGDVETDKTFTLKFIIQELIRLYNRNIFSNFKKNYDFTYAINM
jgi:hypothetical protein